MSLSEKFHQFLIQDVDMQTQFEWTHGSANLSHLKCLSTPQCVDSDDIIRVDSEGPLEINYLLIKYNVGFCKNTLALQQCKHVRLWKQLIFISKVIYCIPKTSFSHMHHCYSYCYSVLVITIAIIFVILLTKCRTKQSPESYLYHHCTLNQPD